MQRPGLYVQVFLTFARNGLIRDMTFRVNFVLEVVTSLCWMLIQLGFYVLIFQYTQSIADWGQYQFFVFMATTLIINSLMQTFFLPNAEEFSELIRSGGLDFALLKPIDTQFLISMARIQWSALGNCVFGLVLLGYSLWRLYHETGFLPGPGQVLLYPLYIACGLAILYGLLTAMAATSIWLGRNQNMYDFWFYVTNFSRYPMEIYRGTFGTPLRIAFTVLVPVLIVVNVPARLMARPLSLAEPADWGFPLLALVMTAATLLVSRWIFHRALTAYRSASS